ncbi:hypothetical protein ACSQ67_022185 [Phaseolus vulgaris]
MPKCSFGIEGTMHEEVLTFMEKTRQCVDAPIGQMNFYSNVFTLVLSIVGLVVLIPPIRYMTGKTSIDVVLHGCFLNENGYQHLNNINIVFSNHDAFTTWLELLLEVCRSYWNYLSWVLPYLRDFLMLPITRACISVFTRGSFNNGNESHQVNNVNFIFYNNYNTYNIYS